ncbi:MAG: tRNA (guanine-N1)-methyltransferase [Vampirovibrio sp.]|jgi:tRNA (guanine37-N1)-methyltransferase|nr:tRNA (guanine-N1)-methyltransferase [Vampirovibrio sp.]
MKFSILTLFPEIIEAYASASIIGRARKNQVIEVEAVNFRDFTADPHRKVDDSPFGGGSGMVLACQPIESAFESLLPLAEPARILITTPAGRRFDHAYALELAQCQQIVMLCGHYEGFDERIMQLIPHIEEVSIGDFVLTGGELPALCIMDSVTRLIPGAVQKFSSVEADSFYDGLLDYPHYTRPADYKGLKVPDVLLSGNHAEIAKWRKAKALEKTQALRPDLLNSNLSS